MHFLEEYDCEICDGSGYVMCWDCRGKGYVDIDSNEDCDECNGAGVQYCDQCYD